MVSGGGVLDSPSFLSAAQRQAQKGLPTAEV